MTYLPEGYSLEMGSSKDKYRLIKYMKLTYQELFPNQLDFSHLNITVERYFTQETPIWWIKFQGKTKQLSTSVACLWMGNAVDQVTGDYYGHIFLIYVTPEHRRLGLATALIHHAQIWAKSRGDRQLGLQVFNINQPALNLYHNLGFVTKSYLMLKPLDN
ncbi:GNAT family N-acetyltransferase [Aphanothece sacrum]|uniref:Acetyltransferase n=1 Tax=Aphanothece sacrum FPU1 TaxID=1920663 RepID=A0A401IH61_APHSA|nr:GNAT family N-acetyltransferase [Aphanothece sacrum]GBF80623.1 acetyltransferase [Aphanothece sacrum FPU1]GBF83987.1 acetyltransferase [Aphanothece sacrum FPU3]